MIGKEEISAKAEEFDLNTSDVQRDYVFGWLVSGLYSFSRLGDLLVLKGGNALRKGYLPDTRFSDDLDFTTTTGLNGADLVPEFNRICDQVSKRCGLRFETSRNQLADEYMIDRARRIYKLRIYFRDLFGNPDHITLKVRLDITEYDRIYLPVQSRELIHPYSDAAGCVRNIRCIKLEEALADKLKCLLQRRYSHDLFDLFQATLTNPDLDRSQLITTFLRKTIFEPSPATARSLLLALPFELMREFWARLVCPKAIRPGFDPAVAAVKNTISLLFESFNYGAHLQAAYFPAEFRNPILEAGGDLRLMVVTYDGIERSMEPYSLLFKRRRDGVAQEYFYGWDRTGGHSSGPGIKAMVRGGIQSLKVTNEHFEPRFPVELRKAGDRGPGGALTHLFTSGRRLRRFARLRP